MVVHTDQGLRETTILDVKCEGAVGDWGGGCASIVHTTQQCFVIPITLSTVAVALLSLLSLPCTELKLNIIHSTSRYLYVFNQTV